MLEAGEGLCEIRGAGDDVHVALDRSKIMTVGRKAVGEFLGKLNVPPPHPPSLLQPRLAQRAVA